MYIYRIYELTTLLSTIPFSGSMEPAFHRGDLLFLTNRVEDPIRVGEIVVFRIEGREIPIVHRVLKIHEKYECTLYSVLSVIHSYFPYHWEPKLRISFILHLKLSKNSQTGLLWYFHAHHESSTGHRPVERGGLGVHRVSKFTLLLCSQGKWRH